MKKLKILWKKCELMPYIKVLSLFYIRYKEGIPSHFGYQNLAKKGKSCTLQIYKCAAGAVKSLRKTVSKKAEPCQWRAKSYSILPFWISQWHETTEQFHRVVN